MDFTITSEKLDQAEALLKEHQLHIDFGAKKDGYWMAEAGNVFTIELGVTVPKRGSIGLEEDVLVTKNDIEWLSKPQRTLWCV